MIRVTNHVLADRSTSAFLLIKSIVLQSGLGNFISVVPNYKSFIA